MNYVQKLQWRGEGGGGGDRDRGCVDKDEHFTECAEQACGCSLLGKQKKNKNNKKSLSALTPLIHHRASSVWKKQKQEKDV